MSKVNNAVDWAVKVAKDNTHGYSQINRWGTLEKPSDFDCSSLVISAYQQAGIPVKDKGATYTGNMYNAFIKAGFTNVTSSVNLTTGSGLKKGDVLLNHVHHTAMMIDTKNLVQASIDENGNIMGGKVGDQTGYEIHTRSYYNYPWNVVLRFVEKTTTTTKKTVEQIAQEVIDGKWGNGDTRKNKLTAAGYDYNKVQTRVNELLTKKKSIDEIAKEVIQGKWGTGTDRVRKLTAAGYDYNKVQTRVNQLLKK